MTDVSANGAPVVLVVDDEPDILMLVKLTLRAEGFDVRLAADGEQGEASLRAERPDLVLLDIMMPVLDGWSVLEHFAGGDGAVPFVVVSARSAVADLRRAFELGAIDYLTKPFTTTGLTQKVRDVLALSEDGRQELRRQKLAELDEHPAR